MYGHPILSANEYAFKRSTYHLLSMCTSTPEVNIQLLRYNSSMMTVHVAYRQCIDANQGDDLLFFSLSVHRVMASLNSSPFDVV